jgi:hypothetical protein
MINQKQNKTTRRLQIRMKFKFLIEYTMGVYSTCFYAVEFEPGLRAKFHGAVQSSTRVKIQHLWSQYSLLKNCPQGQLTTRFKILCYTGQVTLKTLNWVVIASSPKPQHSEVFLVSK